MILGFARDSAACEVVVGPKFLPWLEDRALPSDDGSILITAYCAGDIAAQLDGGSAHDAALVGGCDQVIATYRQLQRKKPALKLPGVEKLIALQRQHELRKYLQDADREMQADAKKRTS